MRAKAGFTLVELLSVLVIISILTTASVSIIKTISSNQTMGQISNSLSGVLESARNTAMAHNTYVWVGFLPAGSATGNTSGFSSGFVVAAVESTTGQAVDLSTPSNLHPIMKPFLVSNANLNSSVAINGMDANASDTRDITASTISSTGFTVNVDGTPQTFTKIIQINAQGETLVQSSLVQWVNVGLVPAHGNTANVAALQISGTTGEVRLFQP